MFKYFLYINFLVAILFYQTAFSQYSSLSFISLGLVIIAISLNQFFIPMRINKKIVLIVTILVGWVFVPLINSLNYHSVSDNIKYIIVYISYILGSTFFVSYLISSKNTISFIKFLSIIFVIINIIFLLLFIFSPEVVDDIYVRRQFAGVYNNRNVLAIVSVFILSVWVFIKELNENILLAVLIKFSLIVLIITTQSTKGLLGIILIYFIYFIVNGLSKRILASFFLVIFSLLILSSLGFLEHSIERFKGHMAIMTDTGIERSGSSIAREWLTKNGLELFYEEPLSGIGLNNSQFYLYSPYRDKIGSCGFQCGGTYTHNNYVEILASSGIFSFIIFYLPYIFAWIYSGYKVLVTLNLNNDLKRKYRVDYYSLSFAVTSLILVLDYGYVSYESLIKNFFFVLIIFFLLKNKKPILRTTDVYK